MNGLWGEIGKNVIKIKNMEEITNEQKQLMLSGLLGDGSVQGSHVSFNCMYKEYMDYKRQLAGNLTKSEVRESDNLGYKKGSKIYDFSIKSNKYSNYLLLKPLSETIKDLDELGIALWLMDDGSLHKKHYFYNINTHAIPREIEESVLIPKLNEFGIYPEILTETKKDGRIFSYLYVPKWRGGMEISRILRKYVVGCYEYKLIPQEIENAYFDVCETEDFKKLNSNREKTAYILKSKGVKQMIDLLENNVKGKEYDIEVLDKLWEERFPDTNIQFCLFDSIEGRDQVIPTMNFLDENPIVKGSYKFAFNSWKYGETFFSTEGRTLTWTELLRVLKEHGDESHVYLEVLTIKNNNEVFVMLGS